MWVLKTASHQGRGRALVGWTSSPPTPCHHRRPKSADHFRTLGLDADKLAKAEERTQIWQAHKARNQKGPRSPGRPLDYDRRIAKVRVAEDAARADLDALIADKTDVRSAIRSIGDAYHPVDLVTGAMRCAEKVGSLIGKVFATIDEIAGRANLSDRARQRIDKARRVMPKLIAPMTFFHGHLERSLASLNLAVSDPGRRSHATCARSLPEAGSQEGPHSRRTQLDLGRERVLVGSGS